MTPTDKLINKYLAMSGDKVFKDFADFFKEIVAAKAKVKAGTMDAKFLHYLEEKAGKGMYLTGQYGKIFVIIDEGSKEEIEEIINESNSLSGKTKRALPLGKTSVKKKRAVKKKAIKKATRKPKAARKSLGKLVDSGTVAPRGKADVYWKGKVKQLFQPNDEKVRVGAKIPPSYEYTNFRYLENFYGLKGIEFGNWLSQQDRANYLAGLGLALYDMHKAIKFSPKQISCKGKLTVAFGARGSGKALAHFEPGAFVINMTRYSRPGKVKTRPSNFNRVDLILKDGGVGSFAHEYGHALDYFGGIYVERDDSLSLSGGDSTHTEVDTAILKKNNLHGLMEKLLQKIIWKNNKTFSPYYQRLQKAAKTDYYIQRNEIFARAFEVYLQYKLHKDKGRNIFLNKGKYIPLYYLTHEELKKVEPEFDALLASLKKHL